MRSLRRMDELERRMPQRGNGVRLPVSILTIATYTFVKVAGLPTPPVNWLLPTMVSCWVVGLLLAVQRYR